MRGLDARLCDNNLLRTGLGLRSRLLQLLLVVGIMSDLVLVLIIGDSSVKITACFTDVAASTVGARGVSRIGRNQLAVVSDGAVDIAFQLLGVSATEIRLRA